MRLPWRRPLHERLALAGARTPAPHDPGPHWGEVGIHGVARPRRWDAVVSVEAAGLLGDELRFVAVPDRAPILEACERDNDLHLLAAAVARTLPPPYRAEVVRRGERTWAVAANAIEVVRIEADPGGDSVELVVNGEDRTVRVDGAPAFGSLALFARLGSDRYDAYVLHARRLAGDLWELETSPL